MALDSIQNKYLEGEGSPEGIIKGKKGFTYKDTLTNDEYSSLGGDKWRKDVLSNIPIIMRKVSNINNTNELERVEVEEVIFDENSKTTAKIIRNKKLSYVNFSNDSEGESRYIMKDISNNGTDVFLAGSKHSFRFMAEEIISTLNCYIFAFGLYNHSVILRANLDAQTFRATPYNILQISFTIKDSDGIVQDNMILKKGIWYFFECELLTNTTLRGAGVDTTNERGLNLTFNLTNNTSVRLADITIRGEEFEIDETNGTIIGDRGSVFYRRPESTKEAVFGKVLDKTLIGDIYYNNNLAFKIQPPNGIITPQMLGYVCSKELDFTNDASDILQFCFDSPYNVYVPPGLYYISKPLSIRVQKQIELSGNTTTNYPPYAISTPSDNNFFAWLYSDKNIDFINIETSRVVLKGGLIDTKNIPLHDKSAVRIDTNYRVAYCRFENILIQGDYNTLLITGKGTKGIHTDLNVEEGSTGHAYYNKFIGIFAQYCDTVISISEPGEHWGGSNFVNTYTIDIQGDGCKRFIDLRYGNNNKITAECQDRAVLNDEEKDTYPFYISGKSNIIDIFNYDQNYRGSSNTAPHRHVMRYIYAPSSTNILTGRSLASSHPRWLDDEGINGANNRVILNNPIRHYLSEGNYNIISSLNSCIRYANDYGNLSYKGYLAPNDEWFNENLNNANSIKNSVPLAEDNINGCSIENAYNLLSSNSSTFQNPNHTIISEDLGFAELSIKMETAIKIYRLAISLVSYCKKIQVIRVGTVSSISEFYENIDSGHGSYDFKFTDVNFFASEVLIRFIGFTNNSPITSILDVSLLSSDKFSPNINIGKKSQTRIGQFTPLRGIGDGFNIDNEYNDIIDINEDLIYSTGRSLKLEELNSHTVFNNITSNILNIEFNSKAENIVDGVEYFIRNSGRYYSSNNIYPESEAIQLKKISNNCADFVFKDGKDNIILNKGEWVKLKCIDSGLISRDIKILVEIDRSNHNTYSWNINKDTKTITDASTIITLDTTGGNFYNMSSANTNEVFTLTANPILNAFAEVLVNRADQPEITGATYKASKGVPFVPSTNMIMRVENKGVPRGVVYWFEEV